MEFEITRLVHMHRTILSKTEKKRFFWLGSFFLISSAFDIIGISGIGYFLALIMDPSILNRIPIFSSILPKTWAISNILVLLGFIILSVFLMKTILSCWVQKELISYCYKVGARIRVQLMEQYLYAPYAFFITNHTSDIINRTLNYASLYSNLSLVSFMLLLVHVIFVLTILIFLIIFHPVITLLMITLFFMMFCSHLIIVKDRLYQAGQRVNTSGQQIVQSVQEGLSGLKEVRILSKEIFFLERMKKASIINADANGLISIFQRLPFYFLESIMFIFIITLCIVELSLGVNFQSIIALCGVLTAAGIRLLPSLYQIAVAVVSIQSSKNSLETIYENLINAENQFENEPAWPKSLSKEASNKTIGFSRIEFKNVTYRYPKAIKNALNAVNLTIERGQSIGIVGSSGAGKSTLVDILLGLLVPNQGQILLDGKCLPEQNIWVNRFAYIPQVIYLLDATIKQNIVFGELETKIDHHRLVQAIRMAQLEDVIGNLPDGVETVIGENGIRLSGGQRQRVALARAFYHEREIIVMDEATAALDNETEHEVVEAIKRLRQLKTLIIIAHRYTTVEHCDIIYRLENGEVIDSGSFNKVIGEYGPRLSKPDLSIEPT